MTSPQSSFSDPAQEQFTLSTLLAQFEKLAELPADSELELVEVKEGDVLFNEGEHGDSMYIVVAGALGVRVKQPDDSELVIDKLAMGATVGELALLSGQPRSATVFALVDSGLMRISRSSFERISEDERRDLLDMDTTVVARWQRLQLAAVLHTLFDDLSTNELHQLQNQLAWRNLSNGDVLFRQGEAADGMYIVVNGRLRAIVESPEGEKTDVGEVTPGETVGEYGLITAEKRSATVYAVRETAVVLLTKPLFEQLVQEKPDWLQKMTLILVKRGQRSIAQVRKARTVSENFAIVPADPSVDASQFAEELATALSKFGETIALTSQQFDEQYGRADASQTNPADPENVAISSWIGELEAQHSFVLFVADKQASVWTTRCINQADRVIILADPQANPTPGPIEQQLAQMEIPLRTELVLWHPASTERPNGTIKWLQERNVANHHHVKQDNQAHLQRLARRLSGNAIGVVLSGGAALGFAHLGVYKAMRELDIPVDFVGGVSMGSIMGGLFVTDYSLSEIEEISRTFCEKGVLDYTLPLAALTRSKNVWDLLTSVYGHFEIEDLWIPYFCISADLTSAEPLVHHRGSMWRAVRASMSIPGVFLPVVEDGHVLVDGGIMDNFPVSTMAEALESEHILGVLISPFKERKREYGYVGHLSGWKVLWHRLNPFSNKHVRYPSPADILIWSMEINGRRMSRDQESQAELIIAPNVKPFSVTDYEKWEQIAQSGYEAAIEPLQKWREKLPIT